MTTENLSTLKIHKLTKTQYERELVAGRIDENALYLTPDDSATIYVQPEEPADAPVGALWVDPDDTTGGDGSNGGNTPEINVGAGLPEGGVNGAFLRYRNGEPVWEVLNMAEESEF